MIFFLLPLPLALVVVGVLCLYGRWIGFRIRAYYAYPPRRRGRP